MLSLNVYIMINNPSTYLLIILLFTSSSCFVIKESAVPYNVKDSTDYAYLSGLAYCPKKCLETWSCKSGEQFALVDLAHISNIITLASCFIGYYQPKNQIIVSFRGSANA
jgi:hypothetical protein